MGPQLKVLSNRLENQGMEPTAPGLEGKWFIHYTTVAPHVQCICSELC